LQRRLQQIPDHARSLLRIAAVAGRELDLDVLRAIAPETNLDYWLADVSAMVEVQDNRYRFSHDKLREGLLATLSQEQQQAIHHNLAHTLETVHPDNFALLAYHWREAGDITREAPYARSAGLRALEVGTFREAISFLERAIQLAHQLDQPASERAYLEYRTGTAYMSIGLTNEAITHFENGMALLGVPVPGTNRSLPLQTVRAVAAQMWNRLRMDVLGQSVHNSYRSDEYALLARIASEVSIPYSISGKTSLLMYALFQSINWAERAGPAANDSAFLGHAFLRDILGLSVPRLGAIFSRRASIMQTAVTSKNTIASSLRNRALLVGASGDWLSSTAYHEESARLAEEIGDVRIWLTTHSLHLILWFFFASDWSSLIPAAESIRDVAARQDDHQSKGLAICWHILLLVAMGAIEEAQAIQNQNHVFLGSLDEPGVQRYVIAADTVLLWRQDRLQEALAQADQLLRALPTIPGEPAYLIFLCILHELSFTAWEQESSPQNRARATRTLNLMTTYARLYPIGKPLLALCKCWQAGITGQGRQVQRQGAKALQLASQYRMPLFQGLAHYHVARFLPDDTAGQQEHLMAAKAVFENLGEAWYLQKVQSMRQ
jgi:tetratricopeptide (TPR) repeat protein